VVHDPPSTGDLILDGALGIIGTGQGKKPKAMVDALGRQLRTALYARLVAEGVPRIGEQGDRYFPRAPLAPPAPSARSTCAFSSRRC
jgi:Golgi phosphoprotein 3 (GPP34)